MKNTPKIHPACAMMPPLPPKAFADLRASIKRVGLVQPILTAKDGSIIDGKNRLHACELEHVTPVFAPASMNGIDPVVWVLEVNRHRLRTSSQLALAAARLVTATDGRPAKTSANGGGCLTRAAVAQLLKVSKAAIDRAQYLLDHAVPELVAYVEYGEVTLRAACDLAHCPKDQQLDAAAIDAKTVRQAAKEWRQRTFLDHTSVAIEPVLDHLVKTTRRLPDIDRRTALSTALRTIEAELADLTKAASAA